MLLDRYAQANNARQQFASDSGEVPSVGVTIGLFWKKSYKSWLRKRLELVWIRLFASFAAPSALLEFLFSLGIRVTTHLRFSSTESPFQFRAFTTGLLMCRNRYQYINGVVPRCSSNIAPSNSASGHAATSQNGGQRLVKNSKGAI